MNLKKADIDELEELMTDYFLRLALRAASNPYTVEEAANQMGKVRSFLQKVGRGDNLEIDSSIGAAVRFYGLELRKGSGVSPAQ